MAEPFLSEIRLFSFVFAPRGWALCNGQLLPINQNQALFSLLGTTYGGDGRVNFALPDLRGRIPLHMGGNFTLGQRGGEQAHTLSIAELPAHNHTVAASNQPANSGSGYPPARSSGVNGYTTAGPTGGMNPLSVSNVGGSQAHLNMAPFLTINFSIALQGIFPSQT
ncbi:phage tail protein [Herpetosiphon llansteffanensis]